VSEARWLHKAFSVALVLVCFAFGLVLLLFPWVPCETGVVCWDDNYLGNFTSEWAEVWRNPYFRGAISGLGLVNIYVAILEAARLKRFSRQDEPTS
jgi:hypothetical protein